MSRIVLVDDIWCYALDQSIEKMSTQHVYETNCVKHNLSEKQFVSCILLKKHALTIDDDS